MGLLFWEVELVIASFKECKVEAEPIKMQIAHWSRSSIQVFFYATFSAELWRGVKCMERLECAPIFSSV